MWENVKKILPNISDSEIKLLILALEKDLQPEKVIKELADILQIVGIVNGVTISMMQSKLRNRFVANARKMYAIIARENTTLSLRHIGDYINRDHASVLHEINSGRIHAQQEFEFADLLNICRDKVKAL